MYRQIALFCALLGSSFALAGAAEPATDAGHVHARSKAPEYPILGGKGRVSMLWEAPAGAELSMTVLVIQPGGEVPQHVHEKSVEYLYVLEGEAEMAIAGAPFRIGPEDAVRIPMNTPHQAKVVGEKPLKVVQVYSPAGPEQRFKATAPAK